VPSAVESQRTRTKAAASTSDWPAGADELTLIRQMQQALRSGKPQRALGFVAEHERRFPSGSLIEEREAARATARCELAPREKASILATFAARFGTSPYLERVKAACR
jgi:indole-3-glycerol phosphate synthase